MLIKAIATFKIDDIGENGLEVLKDDYVNLRFEIASRAVQQGCAVKATLAEARADAAAMKVSAPAAKEAHKPNKKSKSNDAETAKE